MRTMPNLRIEPWQAERRQTSPSMPRTAVAPRGGKANTEAPCRAQKECSAAKSVRHESTQLEQRALAGLAERNAAYKFEHCRAGPLRGHRKQAPADKTNTCNEQKKTTWPWGPWAQLSGGRRAHLA